MKNVNSRKALRGLIGIVLAFFVMLSNNTIYAATPKINIWHNDIDAVAAYKNIYVGSSSELGLKAENTTVNSATWKSSNTSVMQISGNKSNS